MFMPYTRGQQWHPYSRRVIKYATNNIKNIAMPANEKCDRLYCEHETRSYAFVQQLADHVCSMDHKVTVDVFSGKKKIT